MLLDQFSLLAATAFSGSALGVALFISWMSSRTDNFLLVWSAAMVVFVCAAILFTTLSDRYVPVLHAASLSLLLAGDSLACAGSRGFRLGYYNWTRTTFLAIGQIVPTTIFFAVGLSGLGTIFANISAGLVFGLCGWHFWVARREVPLPMIVNAILFWLTGLSFILCAIPLIANGEFQLEALPANWAEEVNIIMVIIGLTGMGAVSLALNHARTARRHHDAAMTDALTGLLNRRALFDQMTKAPVQAGTAILLLDLDHFKKINDQFGHAGGDLVLERFAGILRQHTSPSDLVARIGGEEFCVAVHQSSVGRIVKLAEDIRNDLQNKIIETPSGKIVATVSIGAAICVESGESFSNLMERADRALYGAKNNGRNQVNAAEFLVSAA